MAIGDTKKFEGAVKPSALEKDVYEAPLYAYRYVQIPLNMQERYEYDTEGKVIYAGYGARGLPTSDTGWLLFKYTYDGSGNMVLKQVAYDSWDNRSSASYA